jgi:hypothetical protein
VTPRGSAYSSAPIRRGTGHVSERWHSLGPLRGLEHQ